MPLFHPWSFCCGFSRLARQGIYFNTAHLVIRQTSNQTTTAGPLSGIRVLDLTRILAGPFMTMLLGDLGAEVIKVEKIGTGDDTRRFGPPFKGDQSVYFMSVNRNKKSIAVDLKSRGGQKIIQELAAKSDVFVENYVPGKLDLYGLGYDQLSLLNPGLVYCSITGYGPDGPKASHLGYDVVAAAESGLMHITGPQGGDPVRVGVAMTDLSTGLYAYGSVLAALYQRQATGRGQKIDCNLLASQVSLLTHLAGNYLNNGMEPKRWGTSHQSIVPYQAFKTLDNHLLVVGAGNNSHFEELCRIVSLPQLLEDERFQSNMSRVEHRDDLIPMLESRFLEHPLEQWLAKFEGCQLPYGPVNEFQQVFSDPQVQHLNLVQTVNHPTAGDVRVIGPAVRFSRGDIDGSQPVLSPPPCLGQHTSQVLTETLHYTEEQIAAARTNRTVE